MPSGLEILLEIKVLVCEDDSIHGYPQLQFLPTGRIRSLGWSLPDLLQASPHHPAFIHCHTAFNLRD